MAYNFATLDKKIKEVENWLKKELLTVRTSRATPTLLDGVQVESYGAKMPLHQVATIGIDDLRTLRVSPWDETLLKPIEKAIVQANLGLGVSLEDKGVRVSFPELTNERRAGLIKVAKEKLEQARISIRMLRDDVWKDIQNKEKTNEITEDEKFRLKKEMEKRVEESGKTSDEIFARKEKEIQS